MAPGHRKLKVRSAGKTGFPRRNRKKSRNLSVASGFIIRYVWAVMKQAGRCLKWIVGCGFVACFFAVGWRAGAADTLTWRLDQNRVDAEISSWTLPRLLEKIADVTGWQIYLEPGTRQQISTKFKDRAPGEALRLLLGDLSFALLPRTNGAPRLFVFRTSLQEATELIRASETASAKKAAQAIANELIVTLKPGASIEELARRLGAKVVGRIDKLNVYRLRFEDGDAAKAAREQLENNGDVASVELNYPIFGPPDAEALTYSSSLPLNLKPKASGNANQIIIGLIDHFNTPGQQPGSVVDQFLLPGLSVSGEAQPFDARPAHGTTMAETILRGLSLALEGNEGSTVRILPVEVYGNNPTTSTFDLAHGIYLAINDGGAMIINLSLGSEASTDFLYRVIKSGHDQGVVFFGAAGNEPVQTPTYPAAYAEVVAVTAGDRRGNVSSYANRGDFVDVIAPGSTIVNYKSQSYLVTGTSVATAYASGMAGGVADKSHLPWAQVEAAIRKNLAVTPKP